jgi:hypothetical protein
MSATSKASGRHRLLGRSAPFLVSLLAACSNTVQGDDPGAGATGAGGSVAGSSGASGTSGSSGSSGTGAGGCPETTPGTGGTSGTGSGIGTLPPQCADQSAITPGKAPLRRLTHVEYDSTVRDIIGETTNPSLTFPRETFGNGFKNDALQQWVTRVQADGYDATAANIAQRVTGCSPQTGRCASPAPAELATLLPCSSGVTTANQATCARTFIEGWVPKAFRRPLTTTEVDELLALHNGVIAIVDDDTTSTVATQFASGIAAVIEAALQAPDFLYKVEFGAPDVANPSFKRPSGNEMATRLSYLFWGTAPDEELMRAAGAGELVTNDGVRTQAERLINDPKARSSVAYFFENVLPFFEIDNTSRDPASFPQAQDPNWWPTTRAAMKQETRTFLEYEVFDPAGSGTWPGILKAPYTFVNAELAAHYGMPAVSGTGFQRVNVDPTRLGLLTQGLFLAGRTTSTHTNPVARGAFVLNHLMCRHLEVPTDLGMIVPPEPYTAPTARQRYTMHSSQAICAGCHAQLDPIGFPFENFDAVGLYRTTENGVAIDASGEVPEMPGGDFGDCPSGVACEDKGQPTECGPATGKYTTPCNGSCAVELARRLSQNVEVMACFPELWLDFAYGQSLDRANTQDVCNRESLASAFAASGGNVKQLLVDITQTDGFLYLGSQE